MSEKTEKPTAKKIRDARLKKGQVPKSKDVVLTCSLGLLFISLWVFWSFIMKSLNEMISLSTHTYHLPFEEALSIGIQNAGLTFLKVVGPVILLTIFAGFSGNIMQIGLLFVPNRINPDLKNINPKKWFKNTFSFKNLFEFFKNIVKALFIFFVFYKVSYHFLDALVKTPFTGLAGLLLVTSRMLSLILFFVILILILLSLVDYILQKIFHLRDLKMTKSEVKREYKDSEGNPEIKSTRKQLHKELISEDHLQYVAQSTVVIVDMDHTFAVSIFFQQGSTPVPFLAAKGAEDGVKNILNTAKESDVPIVKHSFLAQNIFQDSLPLKYIQADTADSTALAKILQDVGALAL